MYSRFNLILALSLLTIGLSAQAIDDAEIRGDGIVVPAVDRLAVVAPSTGQLVFDVNTLSYWMHDGNVWRAVGDNIVGNMIQDADGSTSVQTEPGGLEQVLIEVDGRDRWRFLGHALEPLIPSSSIFMGQSAGAASSDTAYNNVGIGNFSLISVSSGRWNVGIGHNALSDNTSGEKNVAIGSSAMLGNKASSDNVAIGNSALLSVDSSQFNVAIGSYGLHSLDKGLRNVAIGTSSLYESETGKLNTSIGYAAGHNTLGDGNVFLGHEAGFNELGSNKLYIANSNADSADALIYGDFSSSELYINGDLQSDQFTTDQITTTTIDVDDKLTVKSDSRLFGHLFLHALQGLGQSGTAYIQARDHTAATSVGLQFRVTDNGVVDDALAINKDGQVLFQNKEIYFGTSLLIHTTGSNNFFAGFAAAPSASGSSNTAVGSQAAQSLSTGSQNSAIGRLAGQDLSSGFGNTLLGFSAGKDLTTTTGNTMIGNNAGASINNGGSNTIIGSQAGWNTSFSSSNTFIGFDAGRYTAGSKNTFLGTNAGETTSGGPSYDNSIAIGYSAVANCHNCAVIGNDGSEDVNLGIGISAPQSVIHVKQRNSGTDRGIRIEDTDGTYWNTYIDASNDYNFAHDGTLRAYIQDGAGAFVITSDRSVKTAISSVGDVLPRVMGLSPKWYRYNNMSPDQPKVMGFIAQEVEEQFPGIVRQKGKLKTLAYDDFAIISIKAIQELNDKVNEKDSRITELEEQNEELAKRLERLEALVLSDPLTD